MSTSWRINTIFDDRSQRVLPSTNLSIGATVVRAERSIEAPVLFQKGETTKILNMLGEPTSNNPELLEAIEYNKAYPLWIVSPSSYGLRGGLIVGPSGIESLGDGIISVSDSMEAVEVAVPLVASGTTLLNYTGDLTQYSNYTVKSIKIYIEGAENEDITATEGTSKDTLAGTPLDTEGVNQIDTTDGGIEITFTEAFSDANLETTSRVWAVVTLDLSSEYCLISSKGAGATYEKAYVIESDTAGSFKLYYQIKNTQGTYYNHVASPIEFSLTLGATNGFGEQIGIDSVFEDNDFFEACYTDGATYSSYTDATTYTALSGGSKLVTDIDFTTGYGFFESFRTYSADIFFDATLDDSIPALFSGLRTNYQKFSKFILPLANDTADNTISTGITDYGRGISFYWGWFELLNLYSTKGNIVGIPIGEVALRHADSNTLSYGGLAPTWIDENGVGGQLKSGRVIRAIYDPSEAQLQQMDEEKINPIIYDPTFGVMIVSRRTSLATLSDDSFIDYSAIKDYIVKTITTQVLPYQIVKMNDAIHRNIVRSKTESILQPMTIAPYNVINSYAIQCDSKNNDKDARAREEFRLNVAIKVTPKSRTIIFTFVNTPQSSTVEEMLA